MSTARDYASTGFRAITRIREIALALGLTAAEARRAMPDPAAFLPRPLDIPEEAIARIDAMAAVSGLVDRVFPDPKERQIWIRGQHRLSDLGGRRPIELLLSGSAGDLSFLRAHLEFWIVAPEIRSDGTGRKRAAA
ncbi:hypothetical protein [Jannaschia formosa]|uniref:hypothetical protein n=1 Tax=Jannaschia formosa TaxID=2259592 RepID=UPI000E1BCBDC|nr:hypothetical protein [Jannaschia formosa]TFL16030.1 hypothetical protein DR046_22145 [Jannaschia formosa]